MHEKKIVQIYSVVVNGKGRISHPASRKQNNENASRRDLESSLSQLHQLTEPRSKNSQRIQSECTRRQWGTQQEKLAWLVYFLCTRHFAYITSFNPHNNPWKLILLLPLYRRENYFREGKWQDYSAAEVWFKSKSVSFQSTFETLTWKFTGAMSLLGKLEVYNFIEKKSASSRPYANTEPRIASKHFYMYYLIFFTWEAEV